MGVAMIGVIAMAPFPDIDLHLNVTHRGPTHSIWFAILAGLVYAAILVYSGMGGLSMMETAGVGFASGFVGVIGHMIGDMITPMGVAPLEPVSSYFVGLAWCKSANERVNRGLMQTGVYLFVAAIVLGTVGIDSFIDPFIRILS